MTHTDQKTVHFESESEVQTTANETGMEAEDVFEMALEVDIKDEEDDKVDDTQNESNHNRLGISSDYASHWLDEQLAIATDSELLSLQEQSQ